MELNEKLISLSTRFDIQLDVESVIPIKGGHINSSFRLKNSISNQPDVLLQKVNHHVFTDVDALMNNLVLVTNHIKNQKQYREMVADIIPTKSGEYVLKSDGEYWRMLEFIDQKKAFEVADSAEVCRKAGFTYGSFLKAVEGIPISEVNAHLPDFHDINVRLSQLDEALKKPVANRLKNAESSLQEIDRLRDTMSNRLKEAKSKNMPLRILHNDTKLSNVLLGERDLGTVVDLDTVMPGYVFFDVGDALRSIAVNAKEDERDCDSIELLSQYKQAFVEGYLAVTDKLLEPVEVESLDYAGAYMAYIMGVRFITDYLNGDVYYSTSYPEHNLVRAKNQLKVCALFSTQ
ncbi:MAG: phosphotransferase [Balneolaceae bacterium]|nr:phosphotransferase [Balneolaceae bacterium]